MEWKMDWKMGLKMQWNGKCTQLQLTCVVGVMQSRLKYLAYFLGCYLTAEALEQVTIAHMLQHPSMVM